jgi:hypothetical protein
LPSLVNGSHPAIAQQIEYFELRKAVGEFMRLRRNEAWRRAGFGGRIGIEFWFGGVEPNAKQALRAQTGWRIQRHITTALRTRFYYSHATSLGNMDRSVTVLLPVLRPVVTAVS